MHNVNLIFPVDLDLAVKWLDHDGPICYSNKKDIQQVHSEYCSTDCAQSHTAQLITKQQYDYLHHKCYYFHYIKYNNLYSTYSPQIRQKLIQLNKQSKTTSLSQSTPVQTPQQHVLFNNPIRLKRK